jgi:glycosyltransferase involved in cell wall biosynthesis
MSTRVVLLRGAAVSAWDLRPYELLGDPYEVRVLVPRRNLYPTSGLGVAQETAPTLSDRLPAGRLGGLATRAIGERHLGLRKHLQGADIVHVAELGNWYSAHAAALRDALGFRLVVTAWETLPLLAAYRNVRTRGYARRVLAEADRFLPTTERARDALLLEGAPSERIAVCPPGVDVDAFAAGREPRPDADGSHLLLSVGRLVWEKGHQDLLRAVALLRRGGRRDLRVLIVGAGPEEGRLRALASDLDLADIVSFSGTVSYEEMPALYARASCLVLASLPVRYWEEQFGMVLAEAMAAHVAIVASTSGAIPEVVGADGACFAPGDWVGLARALELGPLARAPAERVAPEAERLERFSTGAATARLRAVYDELLSA